MLNLDKIVERVSEERLDENSIERSAQTHWESD